MDIRLEDRSGVFAIGPFTETALGEEDVGEQDSIRDRRFLDGGCGLEDVVMNCAS